MPTLLEVSLRFSEDSPLFLQASGRAAQSLFLNALSALDPDLSESVKFKRSGAPPYSVGRITLPRDLVDGKMGPRGYITVPADAKAKFFLGLADDDLVDPALKALQGSFKLGQADVEIEAKVKRSDSYSDLLASQPARLISFKTRNPLVLGKVRREDYPECVPAEFRWKFERWDPWKRTLNPAHLLNLPYRAWNAYAPETLKLPGVVLRALEVLEVVKVDLTWRSVEVPVKGKMKPEVGYTGLIELSAGGLDALVGSIVAGLARLAEYTGLGSRTTEGFGSVSVRLISP